MTRSSSLLLALLVLVVAGVLAGRLAQREQRVPVPLAAGLPQPAPATGDAELRRRWQPFPGEEITHRTLGDGLGRPALLTASGDGLYLVDYEDFGIKRLSPDLDVTLTLRPPSPAPGETPAWDMAQPMDLAVASGRLWVSDPQGGQILAFREEDGTLERTLRLEAPFRIAAGENGELTVLVPQAEGHIFERYAVGDDGGDADDTVPVRRFGSLVEPEMQMPYTLDGFLVADQGGGVLYALRHRPLLAAYGPEGRLRYLVKTVADSPPQEMIEDGTGALRGDPDAPFALLDADLHDGTVYVLTTLDGTITGDGVIDAYAARDGAYLHSWRLPETWRSMAVTTGRLHALTPDALHTYRWPPSRG